VARRDDLVVIEVALNGVHSKKHAAQIPTTPDEIAADMIRCLDAGASICHAHDAITPDATSADLERIVAATYRQVLAEYPDAILYPASTWGGPLAQRWSHHAGLARDGLIKTGFVDPGSTNLGVLDADGVPAPTEFIYAHSYADIRWWFAECERLRLAPNLSIFEPGFLQAALAYERAGKLPAGTYARFYFGGGEYLTARPGPFSFGNAAAAAVPRSLSRDAHAQRQRAALVRGRARRRRGGERNGARGARARRTRARRARGRGGRAQLQQRRPRR
jgi:hypothetical protein